MCALDHAFCLQVGEAIAPQNSLHTFCLALGTVFSENFSHVHSQILLKEKEDDEWKKLAEISQDESQIYRPLKPLEGIEQSLLLSLLSSDNTLNRTNGFHLWLPLNTRGLELGCLLFSSSSAIKVDKNAAKILSHMLSGHLFSFLDNLAYLNEKKIHSKTKKLLNQETNAQKGLIDQLHILHEISLKLWHSHSMDEMLHTAVYECIHSLDIDRMAIFLYMNHCGLIQGTYGTDIKGEVTNEQWYTTSIEEHHLAKTTLDKRQHINICDDTPLHQNNIVVGKGWSATISLWEENNPIGWIACDNLITGRELKSYHTQLLKLLGITISQHLIQCRAQDTLKNLNLSLEQRVFERTEQLETVNKRLTLISTEDSLTHVPNRRMLDEKLDEEWRRALRHKTPLALLIVDIDHFKQYNDRYGHAAGDQCLVKVAKALSCVERRAGALLARFGGEEFVFLLPNCDQEMANIIAKKALKAVMDLKIIHEDSPVCNHVTISVGGKCTIPKKMNKLQKLFIDADVALYEAKSSGKNCAFVF